MTRRNVLGGDVCNGGKAIHTQTYDLEEISTQQQHYRHDCRQLATWQQNTQIEAEFT